MKSELIYGIHTVSAQLDQHPERVERLWLQNGRQGKVFAKALRLAQKHALSLCYLSRVELDRLCGDRHHQGIVARCDNASRPVLTLSELLLAIDAAPPLLLMLDGVEDPHNLGACMRSAAAVGADAVVIPRSRGVGLTAAVHKASCGASQTLPLVRVANFARALQELGAHGIQTIGATADSQCRIDTCNLCLPSAIVLGGEHHGLRRLTREYCDTVASIPMQGAVASFNVSVAAGICLYEAMRQRAAYRRERKTQANATD